VSVLQSAPAIFEYSQSFSDIDEFSEAVRAWDLDVTQLCPGQFEGSLRQVLCGPFLVSHVSFNRIVELRACAPPDTHTFALHFGQPAHWCGGRPNKRDLQTHAGGADVHVITPSEYDAYTITVGDVYLRELCECLGIKKFGRPGREIEVFSCAYSQVIALYKLMQIVVPTMETNIISENPEVLEKKLKNIVRNICLSIEYGRPNVSERPTLLRRKALEETRKYIEHFSDEPPNISDLLRVSKVSERTLHYSFLEEFGVTPKAYTKAHRLNAVHKELRKSGDSKTKIVDIANRWGFWHMGQFASDYRNMFGDQPSKTLRDNAT